MPHFLDLPENSVTRERVYLAKFEFDLRLAAARAHWPITFGITDVDRYGYDVMLNNHDDDEYDRKIQLKTRAEEAETDDWHVFKRFFRPRMREAGHLGIPFTPETLGLGGSIIVMEIADPHHGTVRYRYTDQLVVIAFAEGIIERAEPPYAGHGPYKDTATMKAKAVIAKLDRNIEEKHRNNPKYDHKRIAIPSEVFLTAKGPDHLLGLLSFRNTIDDSYRWPNLFLQHRSLSWTENQAIDLQNTSRETIAHVSAAAHALLGLIEDADVTTCLPRILPAPSAPEQ